MSANLANAFRQLLGIHSRTITLERLGTVPLSVTVKVTPANYSRNLAGPEEIIIEGREYVVAKGNLDDVSFPMPKRGDRIKDPDIGVHVISEVRELYGFGGTIIGYRLRCS